MAVGPPRRIAVIAGGGAFPREVAQSMRRAGFDPSIVALRGFAERETRSVAAAVVDMLDPAGLVAKLGTLAPEAVVLAGGVLRPGPMALASAYSAFRNRADIARFMSRGDDGLLREVIAFIEERGWPVLGIDAVAPDLLAPEGVMGAVSPSPEHRASVACGAACLDAVSSFDVGQAVVVAGARILAVEGPEGTRAMLERVAVMRRKGRLRRDDPPGILVKAAKREQDRRVDLPAVGRLTVGEARKAGLAGIAVAAGDVVMIDRAAMVREADAAGLFVLGVRR